VLTDGLHGQQGTTSSSLDVKEREWVDDGQRVTVPRVQLTDTPWPAVGDQPLLCIPVGACEQHGPHLPLQTDTIIAEALAARLANERTDVVVGPSLTVTASGEHAGFPGTLSIGTDATATVIVELVRSADWSGGVVLVNGHGGNRDAVDRAMTTLDRDGRAALPWWPCIPGGDAHAGRTETSLLLALRPDLVRLDAAAAGETAPLAVISTRLRTIRVRGVAPNGVLGDPTGATADEGRALLDRLTSDLRRAVDTWLDGRA
jgi:mycofactocin precursor peptide peptidase